MLRCRQARNVKARSTRRLATLERPVINSVARGTLGHTAASDAWRVLAKNPWYTDRQKYLLCNTLAANMDWLVSDELTHPEARNLKPKVKAGNVV